MSEGPQQVGRRDYRDARGDYKDPSRCRTPGCIKYHDFFQWGGKYYCLECYDALVKAEKGGDYVLKKEEPAEEPAEETEAAATGE